MTGLDWVFAALCTLAAALLLGWLDVPLAASRAAARMHRPHLPQRIRHSYAQLRLHLAHRSRR